MPWQDKEYYPNIRRCLISGFFQQVACLESEKRGAYSMLREGQDAGAAGVQQSAAGMEVLRDRMVRSKGKNMEKLFV